MNPYTAYATADSSVDEDNKPKLVLKVFQAMLEKLDVIKVAIRSGNYEKKYNDLRNLTAVVEILDSSLDMSYGDIPRNLSSLYQYVVRRLLEVHSTNNERILDECKAILTKINEGLMEAYNMEKRSQIAQGKAGTIPLDSSYANRLI